MDGRSMWIQLWDEFGSEFAHEIGDAVAFLNLKAVVVNGVIQDISSTRGSIIFKIKDAKDAKEADASQKVPKK